jgi:hypothetical protein
MVANFNGVGLPGSGTAAGTNTGTSGMGLILTPSATAANVMAANGGAGSVVLTPTRAAQIDRKMDDGKPGSGYVQAYGVPASCYGNGANPPVAAIGIAATYSESVTTNDCGLVFRIQG